MTNGKLPGRARIEEDFGILLERLPRMGSVMVNTRWRGATHERMGPVAEISREGASIRCRGETHDSEMDLSAVSEAILDRTAKMGEMALPRIDFRDAAGGVVFSVIGIAGLEPFDAGLAGIAASELTEPAEKPAREPAELGENDPGAGPFEAAMKAGATVVIEQSRPGFVQRWTGTIGKVSPAMGFVNVMRPDFHLHLRGGAVAGWRAVPAAGGVRLSALDAAGEATGLSISGPAGALGQS